MESVQTALAKLPGHGPLKSQVNMTAHVMMAQGAVFSSYPALVFPQVPLLTRWRALPVNKRQPHTRRAFSCIRIVKRRGSGGVEGCFRASPQSLLDCAIYCTESGCWAISYLRSGYNPFLFPLFEKSGIIPVFHASLTPFYCMQTPNKFYDVS